MKTRIIFNSKAHSYVEGSNITYSSVSKLIEKYKQAFDADYWITYKAYQRLLGEDFKSYKQGYKLQDKALFSHLKQFVKIKELNKAKKDIKQEWLDEKNKSILKGNTYHTYKEQQSKDEGFCLNTNCNRNFRTVESTIITIKDNVEYREPSVSSLKDLSDGFHPELILWNKKFKLAGQADKVFIETIDGVRYIDIDDYKTNKAIKKANFFGKMKAPLHHLDDCNYNHYRLQISTYAWMLEQEGFVVRSTRFTHLNKVYDFDYMKHEVELMLGLEEQDNSL